MAEPEESRAPFGINESLQCRDAISKATQRRMKRCEESELLQSTSAPINSLSFCTHVPRKGANLKMETENQTREILE